MGYAFISYSTQNKEIAYSIKSLFEKNNIQTWIAPNNIPAGSKYAEVINKAVRGASCLVLLLSNFSLNSEHVAKEVERAIHYRKTIIPVQIEDVVLNDEFEYYISTNQIVPIKAVDEDTDEVKKLLTSVVSHVNAPVATDSKIEFPISPSRYEKLPVGAIIDNKYEVLSFEGDTDNAAVYHVFSLSHNANYILLLFSNTSNRTGYYNYHHISNKLRHPDIAHFIDVVISGECTYYLFRKEGRSLSEHIVENYEMQEKDVITLGIQLCEILIFMETVNPDEIHDSLTAANIFITSENRPQLLPVDFKKNGTVSPVPQNLTAGEQFYYAPERLKTGISDTRTAIYALGAVLYAAVVGRDPAREPHVFYPLRKRNSTLSSELEHIILKCMEFDPDKRYQSFKKLHKQLNNLTNSAPYSNLKPSIFSFFRKNKS